ncbi:MAG: response regulator transcription factor [Bacteroides sp.]|nr:response regulator transcription factor [Bacteroides sp.]MCM1085411.1 response regulator transcription factor [Bacteroides sp.]
MKEKLPVKEVENQISILLAEDDPNLGTFLRTYLTNKGYKTHLCRDGKSAYDAFLRGGFNFLITDIMMPVKDGFALAKDIRKVDAEIPILFLTAKTLETDRLKGFQVGADDYLTKPFSMDELLMRIRAIVRRTLEKPKAGVQLRFRIGDALFDVLTQRITNSDGREVMLTGRETELLKVFCMNENVVVSRKEILVDVWKVDNYFNARSMDVYITKLRKALKQVCEAEIINVHGVGFKLVI